MNAKFRMPRFWGQPKFQGTFKEITLSTIATTISIILTFGTAHYIDEKKKRDTARQTAMMVIHDMEINIESLRNMAKNEEKHRNMTYYVMEHLDEIDSVSYDTLSDVLNYLTAYTEQEKPYTIDEASEHVFFSSQESWQIIDNATFIDEVQNFYSSRHEIFDYVNNSDQWQKPVSSKAMYLHQLNRGDGITDIEQFLREVITSKEVRFFLNYSTARQTQLNQFADGFQHISDVCKFNMGITDEELEEYVKNRTHVGRSVKERELEGLWIMQESDDQYSSIEYRDDHTYTQTNIAHLAYPIYDGRVDFKYVSGGTWELRNDTLYTHRQPDYQFEMDRSHITPKPGHEKEVEEYLQTWEQSGLKEQKAAAAGTVSHNAYEAVINASGNKIQLIRTETDAEGNSHKEALFFSRAK